MKRTETAKCFAENCSFVGTATENTIRDARSKANFARDRHYHQTHTPEGRLEVAKTEATFTAKTLEWKEGYFREHVDKVAKDLERCASEIRATLTRNDRYITEREDFRESRLKLAQEILHKLMWMIPNTNAYDLSVKGAEADAAEAAVKVAEAKVRLAEKEVQA